MSANKQHPELFPGEVFISNCSEQSVHRIGWLSKRKGEVAYNIRGERLPNTFPVFARLSEVRQHLSEDAILKLQGFGSDYTGPFQ